MYRLIAFCFRIFPLIVGVVGSDINCEGMYEKSFRCNDGFCIERSERCDNREDCFDRSDEIGCSNVTCELDEFRCTSGQCIPLINTCDYKQHCRDSSDEKLCRCNRKFWKSFRCKDIQFCIESGDRCNSIADCPDGSDEVGCPEVACESDEFRCTSGQCIPSRNKCDDMKHCDDNSDEQLCHCNEMYGEYFRCKDCSFIMKNNRCNDHVDCPDGSDEFGCHNVKCIPEEFRCTSGQCIRSINTCDRVNDCDDNSDELHCPHKAIIVQAINHNRDIIVRAGTRFHLICETSPFKPLFVDWYYEDEVINYESPRLLVLNEVFGYDIYRSELIIKEVEASDAGDYVCAPFHYVPANITVYVERDRQTDHDVILPVGMDIHLICEIGLYKPEMFIDWYHEDELLYNSSRISIKTKPNGQGVNNSELSISSAIPSDSGVYICYSYKSKPIRFTVYVGKKRVEP